MALAVDGEAERCRTLGESLEAMLRRADERWRLLEEAVDRAEEAALEHHFEDLSQRFGVPATALDSWEEGSLRQKVRGRTRRQTIGLVADRMREQVSLGPAAAAHSSLEAPLVLDVLLDWWEQQVEPTLGEALEKDERLSRRARRRERRGEMVEALQVNERERPSVLAPARNVLDAMLKPVELLLDFLEREVSLAAIDRFASMVPAIVARAFCDWHFKGPLAEVDEIQSWWERVREALQQRTGVWELLMEEEGVFLRRMDRGLESLAGARQRYQELVGSFGVLGWPAKALADLVEVHQVLRSWLRPIRDAAAWRVVDAAKSIRRRLREEEEAKPRDPWEGLGAEASLSALLEAAVDEKDFSVEEGLGPADLALAFMARLSGLVRLVGELQASFAEEAAGSGVAAVLSQFLPLVADLNEELLAVLDESTEEGLSSWMEDWRHLSQASGLAAELTRAAAVLASSRPSSAQAAAKRAQLLQLRGVHRLLEDQGARTWYLTAAPSKAPLAAQQGVRSQEEEAFVLLPVPEAAPMMLHSPRTSFAPRRTRWEVPEATTPASTAAPAEFATPLVTEEEDLSSSASKGASQEAAQLQRRPSGQSSFSMSRPGTPSWLQPSWARPQTPSGICWTRPDTPSTTCEDTEVPSLPRWKCVDGQYVPLKISQSVGRLPPLPPQGYPQVPGR